MHEFFLAFFINRRSVTCCCEQAADVRELQRVRGDLCI